MRAARVTCCGLLTAGLLVSVAGALPAQTAVDWPSERPPSPLPAQEVQFPPYHVRTLSNGLQIVAVLQHEQPVVSMRLLVGAGSVHDPADQSGLANLTASLLDQGSTSRTAQEIAETIDTVGGGLGVGAGVDLSFVNIVVMKDSFDLALDLLAEIVREPAFAPAEIDRQRQRILSGLQVSLEDPDYLAGVVFDRLVYGVHPYGRPQAGTEDSLARISRADLVAFHAAYFAPNASILAIVGDLTADEAFDGATRVFGHWARQEIPALELPEPPPPTRRVVVIDKPGAVQTEIRVGHLGVPRQLPDYVALDLAIKVLGGEGSNRLHRVLRSERGLTYGAEASMHAMKRAGDFEAETDTRSEATAEALRLMVEEFWRIQRQRVDPRELRDAQNYLSGSFPLQIETPDAIAMQILNVLFYGLDLEELRTFRERVNAVTVDDIQRVTREYLTPDRLAIVLVGDADTFVDDLPGVGLPVFERISLEDLDLTSPELHRGRELMRPPVARAAPTGSAHERALAVVTRAIVAKGGAERLRSVRTVTAMGNTTMYTPTGPVAAETMTYFEYPERFRVEVDLPSGRLVQVYADGQAWLQSPEGVQDAPPTLRDDFQASARRDLISLLLRATAGELEIRPLLDAVNEKGEPTGVEISADDVSPVKVYLDPETGLVVRQTYQSYGENGFQETEELYSDYRLVEGVQVAFRAIVRRGGVPVLERHLSDMTFNDELEADLFSKPLARQ